MNQIETQGGSVLLEIEEKSKKSHKNETNNLQDIDGEFSKDNKLKSVLNEDEVEKSKGNDGDLSKKVKKEREHEFTENESKLKVKSEKVTFSSDVETFGDSCLNATGDFLKDDGDEDEKVKGNDGILGKNVKNKRNHEVTENESNTKVKSENVCFSSDVETFGDSCLNATGDFSKDDKLKTVLNEDGDEAEKGKRNDGKLATKVKKKRKHEVTENESKSKDKSEKVSFSSHVETDGDSCLNSAVDLSKDNKLKSVLNEDEVEKGKGNDGKLAKKVKKRKHEVTENESKSKVNSDKVSFSSDVDTDGDSCLNAAGDISKDNKLKSVVNVDVTEKGKGNDDNFANKVKKRKHDVTENESSSKVKAKKVSFSSHVETDGDSCQNAVGDIVKDNKLKSVLNENEDEIEKGKGNDDSLAKKVNKGKKHEVAENESSSKVKAKKVSFLSHVETDGDSFLNAAGDISKDSKLKSVVIEDEDVTEKGKGNDAKKVKKKRKHEVAENESNPKAKAKKVSFSSHLETDGDSFLNAAADISKDNKLKSVVNEDEDVTEKGKGNDAKKVKKKRKHEVTENESNSKVKAKKVSFSSHVETFPSADSQNEKSKTEEDKLVRGKRFTPEEDELVKDAVLHYIKLHALGEEGLNMVLNCNAYPEIRNCWREIGTCIPYRPHTAIYYRAHTLFERGEKRKWTKEETEFLQKSYDKHGNDWKMVAKELGKNRVHVKDKWRRIKLSNKKGGKWSQEEYQSLYDLVNLDLQMKLVSQEKRSKHGMLRDDIPWGAISDKLSTRTDSTCCQKWYSQLTSSLVAEDKWSNADDYRLIKALYDLDAACVEDVDWDHVLEHRPGDVCRKRWDQMVLHIGHHGSKPFSDQVEILSERYCPDLAETREAWDSKPLGQ